MFGITSSLVLLSVVLFVANATKFPANGPIGIFSSSFSTSQTYQGEAIGSTLNRTAQYAYWYEPPFLINLTESCQFIDDGFNDWDFELGGAMFLADVTQLVQEGGYVAAACNWTTNDPVNLESFGLVFISATNVSGTLWPSPYKGPCFSSQNTSCYPNLKVLSAGPQCVPGETCPLVPRGSWSYSWDLSGPLPAAVTTPGAAAILGVWMNTTGTSSYCSIGNQGQVTSTLSCAITILLP